MALVLLLLCSGLFHAMFATQRLRLFGDVPNKESGPSMREASETCKKNDSSLVTVYDEEDAKFLYNFTDGAASYPLNNCKNCYIRNIWLGLHHVGNYTWSNGEPVIFNLTSETLQYEEQKCEAIHYGTWQSFSCSEKKSFMCSKGNSYTLHPTLKTWCQALQHCRNTHSELVSINSTEQNEEVIKKGEGSSFWIGLRHDEWEWDDDGCSSFRKWSRVRDPKGLKCTAIFVNETSTDLLLYPDRCGSARQPFCVAGHVRIKVIDQRKKWADALDYCMEHHSRPLWIKDGNDQKAVEQWLEHTNASGPFWIGLRQSRVFGFWIWSDSVVLYSNWKNGEEPEPSMYNLCGVIDRPDYKWYEEDCLTELPFLCEEDIVYM